MNTKNEQLGDLDWIAEIMPTKFERNWDRGRDLDLDRKQCVQNEWDLGEWRKRHNAINRVVAQFAFHTNFIMQGSKWRLKWSPWHILFSKCPAFGHQEYACRIWGEKERKGGEKRLANTCPVPSPPPKKNPLKCCIIRPISNGDYEIKKRLKRLIIISIVSSLQ